MKTRKIIIIAIAVIVLIILGGGTWFKIASDRREARQKQEQENMAIAYIDSGVEDFNTDDLREHKLTILQDMKTALQNDTGENEAIHARYTEAISSMTSYFIDDYSRTLEDNTIETEHIDELTSAVERLKELLSVIEQERAVVNDNAVDDIAGQTQALVDKFETEK